MRSDKPILIVEDDRVDMMTIMRALRDRNIPNQSEVASTGEEALNYLESSSNEKPCIILLDLNLPRMNGLEFLERLKRDASLKTIPVVVLTTSDERRDKQRSFELGAVGYIIKPSKYSEFAEAIAIIDLYWTCSQFPPER